MGRKAKRAQSNKSEGGKARRFQVGDEVLCKIGGAGVINNYGRKAWVRGRVTRVFRKGSPAYEILPGDSDTNPDSQPTTAPSDEDHVVRRYSEEVDALECRYGPDTFVLFRGGEDSSDADSSDEGSSDEGSSDEDSSRHWNSGFILETWCYGGNGTLYPYLLDNGWYVPENFVTCCPCNGSIEDLPLRTRLEKAAAHCCIEHLRAIACQNELDVRLLAPESMLEIAAAEGNAAALWWLLFEKGVEIPGLDSKGKSLMHRLVTGKDPAPFLTMICTDFKCKDWIAYNNVTSRLLLSTDRGSQTVLHDIAVKGDEKLMAILTSPKMMEVVRRVRSKQDGLRLYECKDSNGRTAVDCARILGHLNCEKFLEDLAVGAVLLDMKGSSVYDRDKKFSVDHWKAEWEAIGVSDIATLVLAPDQAAHLEVFLHKAVLIGQIEMAKWLVNEWKINPGCTCTMYRDEPENLGLLGRIVFNNPHHIKLEEHDRCQGVFQRRYRDKHHESDNEEHKYLQRQARRIYNKMIVGQATRYQTQEWDGVSDFGEAARRAYKACLNTDRDSMVGYDLQKELEGRIAILEDSPDLEALLQISEWLLTILPQPRQLPPLQYFILYRHCGLLAWFVQRGLVDLDAHAAPELLEYARSVAEQYVNDNMCTKQVLLILSTIYGDFRTMEWLITTMAADPCLQSNGYNLLHIAAKHQELEVAVWLVRNHLVPLTAVNSAGEDAAIIAMAQGFLLLGEFLMEQGSLGAEDANGHDVVWHALQSGEEDVVKWAKKRSRKKEQQARFPAFLQDLTNLGALVFGGKLDKALLHIEETDCLEHSKIETVFEEGPDSWYEAQRPIFVNEGSQIRCVWDPEKHQCMGDMLLKVARSDHIDLFSTLHHLIGRKSYGVNSLFGPTHRKSYGVNPLTEECALEAAQSRQHSMKQHILEVLAPSIQEDKESKRIREEKNAKWRALQPWFDKLRALDHSMESGADVHVIKEQLDAVLQAPAEVFDVKTPEVDWMLWFQQDGMLAAHRLENEYAIKIVLPRSSQIVKWLLETGRWNDRQSLTTAFVSAAEQGLLDVLQVIWYKANPPIGAEAAISALVRVFKHYFEASWERDHSRSISVDISLVQFLFDAVRDSGGDVNAFVNDEDGDDTENVLSAVLRCLDCGRRNLPAPVPIAQWILAQPDININRRDPSDVHLASIILYGPGRYNALSDLTPEDALVQAELFQTFVARGMELSLNDVSKTTFHFRHLCQVPIVQYLSEVIGLDIQPDSQDAKNKLNLSIFRDPCFITIPRDAKALGLALTQLQHEQNARWQLIDKAGKAMAIEELRQLHSASQAILRNRLGANLLHIAAFSNRVDVLEWMWSEQPLLCRAMSIQPDNEGRTALQLASAAAAVETQKWLERFEGLKRGAILVTARYRQRKAVIEIGQRQAAIILLQARWRGHSVRNLHWGALLQQLEARQGFWKVWGAVIGELAKNTQGLSWEGLREEHEGMTEDAHSDEEDEEAEMLDRAQSLAVRATKKDSGIESASLDAAQTEDSLVHAAPGEGAVEEAQEQHALGLNELDSILLTAAVLTWYKHADARYAELFRKRVFQLAAGERSRILQKHLTGCKTHIYETYLDQASAQRLLWTEVECTGGATPTILIWYVSKHKRVSRLIRLIDEAEARWNRISSASDLFSPQERSGKLVLGNNEVLVDPKGNRPLKLHQLMRGDFGVLCNQADWNPPLRLTAEERAVVEKPGTVLLLGRSGTGKTICICNKMSHDRQLAGPELTQLFVARSRGICEFVRRIQVGSSPGALNNTSFITFRELLDRVLGSIDRFNADQWRRDRYVDFNKFKMGFFPTIRKRCSMEPCIVWTQIRSFIKGSIEAVVNRSYLTEDEYLQLGSDRCRINTEQRKVAYEVYRLYEVYRTENDYWDVSDRMFNTAVAMMESDELPSYHRVYCDEVQDLTQSELAILFMLCDARSLFLAGDTAQAVVQGVDFRFQEVRSVVYHLSKGNKHLVPEKPLHLTLNFRSHSGILDLAAAVLGRLFEAYPGAANKLPPDQGLYKGPRPGILQTSPEQVCSFFSRNPKFMILTPETGLYRLEKMLSSDCPESIVMSIPEAKGLESHSVALVDFFQSIPPALQKPAKILLQGGDVEAFRDEWPELEAQLKSLYTAITRCCSSLVLIESKRSIAGTAFFRWLRDHGLAEPFDDRIDDSFLTPDEWRVNGLTVACQCNGSDRPLEFLQKALRCFENAGDAVLSERARIHIRAIQTYDELSIMQNENHAVVKLANVMYSCLVNNLFKEAFMLAQGWHSLHREDESEHFKLFVEHIFYQIGLAD